MFNIHFFVEKWKWNADFGIYVSNKGHFRSRDKKDLAIKIGNKGYCYVYCEGTVNKYRLAHRVVMLTWCPTDDAENLTVDHKDHNKRNNAVDNLEWVTFEENQKRAREDEIIIEEEKTTESAEEEVCDPKFFKGAAPNTPIHELFVRLPGGAIIPAIKFFPLIWAITPSGFNNPTDHKKKVVELMLKRKPKIMGIDVKYMQKK